MALGFCDGKVISSNKTVAVMTIVGYSRSYLMEVTSPDQKG